MPDAPYALALAAGLVAAVNPCGFALLPAYLSLLVVGEGEPATGGGRTAAIARGLVLTAAMTLGFIAVFGGFGLLAAPAADAVARRLPWLSIVIGVALVGAGGWLVAGRSLPSLLPRLSRAPAVSRRFGSMALFGAAYAVASLGCTIGPFLGLVVASGSQGGPLAGVGLFLAYGAGMGLLVGSVAVAVALARASVVTRLRRAVPLLSRVGGGLVLLAGGYVAWYGWYELRSYTGDPGDDPVVDAFARIQTPIASWLDSLGPVPVVAAFAGLLGLAAAVPLVPRVRRRYRSRAGRQPPEPDRSPAGHVP
jgi:cytochrome c biogenesis protein CcdA